MNKAIYALAVAIVIAAVLIFVGMERSRRSDTPVTIPPGPITLALVKDMQERLRQNADRFTANVGTPSENYDQTVNGIEYGVWIYRTADGKALVWIRHPQMIVDHVEAAGIQPETH